MRSFCDANFKFRWIEGWPDDSSSVASPHVFRVSVERYEQRLEVRPQSPESSVTVIGVPPSSLLPELQSSLFLLKEQGNFSSGKLL